jgi:hypothetical protein
LAEFRIRKHACYCCGVAGDNTAPLLLLYRVFVKVSQTPKKVDVVRVCDGQWVDSDTLDARKILLGFSWQ